MAVFRTLYSSLGTFDKMLCRTCLFRGKIKGSSRFELSRMVQRVPKDQIMLRKGFVSTSHSIIPVRPLSTQSQGSFLTDLKSSPPPALFLGFTGAIPFCGLATMSLIFPEFTSSIVQAQQAYGACILSFLGAIHWGYALAEGSKLGPSWSTLSYSVSPSLIAWTSLLLHPVPGLMTLCVGLAFALSKDLKITHFPAWYHALRKALSTLAVASLGFTGVVFYFH